MASNVLSKSGVAFFGSLCVGTFGLGCWQTQRYFEKVEMVKKREEELAMEPKEFSGSSEDSYRRTIVRGSFRHEDEVLVGPRGPPLGGLAKSGPMSGRSGGGMGVSPQGFYVITPLYRENTQGVVLVNRGWVPQKYVNESINWNKPEGPVKVIGTPSKGDKPRFLSPVHKPGSRILHWIDRDAIEAETKTKASVLLTETDDRDLSSSISDSPFPLKPTSDTVGEFKVMPFTHATYAVTWFGLSGAGVIMMRKLVTRGRM